MIYIIIIGCWLFCSMIGFHLSGKRLEGMASFPDDWDDFAVMTKLWTIGVAALGPYGLFILAGFYRDTRSFMSDVVTPKLPSFIDIPFDEPTEPVTPSKEKL